VQDNDFRPSLTTRTGLVCRFARTPKALGVGLLVVPVAAAVGAFGLLPSTAASATSRPPAQVQLTTSGHGPGQAAGEQRRHEGSKKLSRIPEEQAMLAWFDAGFVAEDAEELAAIWDMDAGDLHDVKVLAGRKLVAGRDLPVEPTGTPATEEEVVQREQLDAFLDAGYDGDDAEVLARYWNVDALEAKYLTGAKLLADAEVPIGAEETPWSVDEDVARQAFFNNGFGYDDAVVLADVWSIDAWDAKANAGHKLLDGLALPFGDDGDLVGAPAEEQALDAYFAAGYGYEDAELLARMWNSEDDVYGTKVKAGHALLGQLDLGVEPGDTAWTVDETAAVTAFVSHGFDRDVAEELADVWSLDAWDAKVNAGHKLLDGLPLPLGH
jgi:hypothetical protein